MNPPKNGSEAVTALGMHPATSNLDGVQPGTADPETLPHTCGGCDARWSGYRTSHCAACHLTLSGVRAFDMHRQGGRCLRPWAMGMVAVPGRAYEVWGYVADAD